VNPLTVGQALAISKASGLDALDAQVLLARAVARARSWVLAHDDALLEAPQLSAFLADVARRADGEPLAYVVGERDFHGLMLRVDPSVLVPRPETELLVDWGLEILRGHSADLAQPRVVDLGTGSGAIALAIKAAHPAAQVQATDISPQALKIARANAARLGLKVEFRLSDWWVALRGQRYHLALANPPYIAQGDRHLEALRHEPALALTPSGDGLGAIACIAAGAPTHLEPGGWLVFEHGHDQPDAVRSLLGQHGYVDVSTRHDLAGHARCTAGRFPA
jgi:release factor glutamine methyltransferase